MNVLIESTGPLAQACDAEFGVSFGDGGQGEDAPQDRYEHSTLRPLHHGRFSLDILQGIHFCWKIDYHYQ